jgi:Ca2+:H+ antiporter
MGKQRCKIALALQGGGAHGAFTRGVLDRLLQEPALDIIGVTGTSAGAMNAVVLADGLFRGGPEGARQRLRMFWEAIGAMPGFGSLLWPLPLPAALIVLAVATPFVALVSEVFVASVEHAAVQFGMSAAFIGFVVVAIIGGAAESFTAITAARKNRLDLSVGIAFGSAAQIALFVAPVLTLASYFIGSSPMDLSFTRGQVSAVFIAMLTAALVANSGKSAWFTGTQMIAVYMVFAITLYLLPG